MSTTPAYDALVNAISTYYDTTDPDAYVDSWMLISHRRTPELEKAQQSLVSILSSPEMSWVMRRGMLDIALCNDRYSVEDPDDEADD